VENLCLQGICIFEGLQLRLVISDSSAFDPLPITSMQKLITTGKIFVFGWISYFDPANVLF